jgi:hypothetical protein
VTADAASWSQANHRSLLTAIDAVRARLERAAADPTTSAQPALAAAPLDPPAAFERLRASFGLSEFELAVVLLAAGVELDPRLADLVVAANGGGVQPTLGLALRALPDAHWQALTPAAALRHWRLIELGHGDTLATTPFRLSERTLHFLLGIDYLEPGLSAVAERVDLPAALPESYRGHVERVAGRWRPEDGLLCLDGEDPGAVRAVAAAGCAALGLDLHTMRASAMAVPPAEREPLQRLWEREALFRQSALLADDDTDGDAGTLAAVHLFIAGLRGPVVVPPRLLPRSGGRPAAARLRVGPLTVAEQRALWRHALGPAMAGGNGEVDELIVQFPLGVDQFDGVAAQVAGQAEDGGRDAVRERVWDVCRVRARAPIGRLAQRIESAASWDDLVLPGDQLAALHEMAAQVRHRAQVYDRWGFGERAGRGLGVSALFAGPSGTGKTLAAEVLANDLRLDLYRIDLSQLVSKYIGETEKNLGVVFEAAERGGAILLFDEADALFGKRSEVKDSHDRYANIEVGYLLQRMESYRGLAILTTNQRAALDQAFLRRLRFVVAFPFPDATQRASIWARVLPAETPTVGLDLGG